MILVDTKYEFGFDADGAIVLADEIHTPDSSRYWLAESYRRRFDAGEAPETLDKDFVRRWVTARCDPYRDPIPPIPREIIAEAARLYIEVFETITGRAFDFPDPAMPDARPHPCQPRPIFLSRATAAGAPPGFCAQIASLPPAVESAYSSIAVGFARGRGAY